MQASTHVKPHSPLFELAQPPSYTPPPAPIPRANGVNSNSKEVLQLELQQHEWMLRNAPVIVQSAHDVANGNAFVGLCYEWIPNEAKNIGEDSTWTVICSLIYESEANYERRSPYSLNVVGSFFYRTYNMYAYQRTADVNMLSYHHVRLLPSSIAAAEWSHSHTDNDKSLNLNMEDDIEQPKLLVLPESQDPYDLHLESPCSHRTQLKEEHASSESQEQQGRLPYEWDHLFSTDWSDLQSFSEGDKGNLLYYYSLVHHYQSNIPRDAWHRWFGDTTAENPRAQDNSKLATSHEEIALYSLENEYRACSIDSKVHGEKSSTSVHNRLLHLKEYNATRPLSEVEATIDAGIEKTTKTRKSYRPVIFVNTANHLMAPFDLNPHISKKVFSKYPIWRGTRDEAEEWTISEIPSKCTCFTLFPIGLRLKILMYIRRKKSAKANKEL